MDVTSNSCGDVRYEREGVRYRDNGPATVAAAGVISWSCGHKGLHRDEGPAAYLPSGGECWYYLGDVYMEEDEYLRHTFKKV